MEDDIYCYPGTNVLKNKFGIMEPEKLQRVERKITSLRLIELGQKPIEGNFDLKHLQAIHKYIFQDIYAWAGKIRTVDIAKSNMFCKVQFISSQAEEIFGKLSKENYLFGYESGKKIEKMAYYFSEINALHPFREGNGRTQREFIRCLAVENGYKLSFEDITEAQMIKASCDSFLCDYRTMEEIFRKICKN